MGLLDGLTPPQRKYPCRFREILDSLEKKDQIVLEAAIINPEWAHKSLSEALRQRGLVITDTSIARHRKGACSCSKE